MDGHVVLSTRQKETQLVQPKQEGDAHILLVHLSLCFKHILHWINKHDFNLFASRKILKQNIDGFCSSAIQTFSSSFFSPHPLLHWLSLAPAHLDMRSVSTGLIWISFLLNRGTGGKKINRVERRLDWWEHNSEQLRDSWTFLPPPGQRRERKQKIPYKSSGTILEWEGCDVEWCETTTQGANMLFWIEKYKNTRV